MPVDFGTTSDVSEGEEFAPAERANKGGVRLPPSRPFHLAAHPMRWDVIDGEVLPELVPIHWVDGLNGQTHGNYRRALADAERRGWTVIPHNVDKKNGHNTYVRKHPVEHNGRTGHVYLDRFTQCFRGTGMLRTKGKEYRAWLQSLIKREIIPLPPIYRVEALAEQKRNLAASYAKRAVGNPIAQARVKAVLAEVEAVEAFLIKHYAGDPAVGEAFEAPDDTDTNNDNDTDDEEGA